jgi:hypothetical protein
LLILAATFALAAPLLATPAHAAAPAGEVRACLLIQTIRQTRVVNDEMVEFITRDGTLWQNKLPNRCPGLGFERAFSYSTSIPQLCDVDVITVFQQSAGTRAAARCGLGKFVSAGPARKPAPPKP